ncbi:hypothetical protein M9458_045533, partial [Cirrhinus mrigala]
VSVAEVFLLFSHVGITLSWQKNGQDHDEDVDLGDLLPNDDGTFQRSSTLSVTPDEWKNNKFICVVGHQDKTQTANEIRTNGGKRNEMSELQIQLLNSFSD